MAADFLLTLPGFTLDVRLPFEDAIRAGAEQWLLLVFEAIIFNRLTLKRTEFLRMASCAVLES
jgi:hypothetical protein